MEQYPLLDVYASGPAHPQRLMGYRDSSLGVTFICKTNGFNTVRNFTKPHPTARRSLQPVKLPDGRTDNPEFKTKLVQDGEHGQVAARNIAWTAVFAPSTPTLVVFTILHAEGSAKTTPKGSQVAEFNKISYLFSADRSQFDIDIEVLAKKETSLLKKRPGGLSIVAEAHKSSTGECLGTSPPVAIRGPNREFCSTPSPPNELLSSESLSSFSPSAEALGCAFKSPDEINRARPLTPSSNAPRVVIKPIPILPSPSMEVGAACTVAPAAAPALGMGFPVRDPFKGDLLRQMASSPSSALAHGMRELEIQPAASSVSSGIVEEASPNQQEEDGRRCSHMHISRGPCPWRSPWLSSAMPTTSLIQYNSPVWIEPDAFELAETVTNPKILVSETATNTTTELPSVNEEVPLGLRKRGSKYCLTDCWLEETALAELEDAALSDLGATGGWKARKLHTGVKDWSTVGGGASDEIRRAHLQQRAFIDSEPGFRLDVHRSQSMDAIRPDMSEFLAWSSSPSPWCVGRILAI